MGLTREYKAERKRLEDISARHAEIFFPQGHEGTAHCQCEMAKEYRAGNELLDQLRRHTKADLKLLKQAAALQGVLEGGTKNDG